MESASKAKKQRRGWGKNKRKNNETVSNPPVPRSAPSNAVSEAVEVEEDGRDKLHYAIQIEEIDRDFSQRESPSLPITPHRVFNAFNESMDLGNPEEMRDILPDDLGRIALPHMSFGIALEDDESGFIHDMRENSYYQPDARRLQATLDALMYEDDGDRLASTNQPESASLGVSSNAAVSSGTSKSGRQKSVIEKSSSNNVQASDSMEERDNLTQERTEYKKSKQRRGKKQKGESPNQEKIERNTLHARPVSIRECVTHVVEAVPVRTARKESEVEETAIESEQQSEEVESVSKSQTSCTGWNSNAPSGSFTVWNGSNCTDESVVEVVEGVIFGMLGRNHYPFGGEKCGVQGNDKTTQSKTVLGSILRASMSLIYTMFLFVPLLVVKILASLCWGITYKVINTIYFSALYLLHITVWFTLLPFRGAMRLAGRSLTLAARLLNTPVSNSHQSQAHVRAPY